MGAGSAVGGQYSHTGGSQLTNTFVDGAICQLDYWEREPVSRGSHDGAKLLTLAPVGGMGRLFMDAVYLNVALLSRRTIRKYFLFKVDV